MNGAQAMLKQGADVNVAEDDGWTSLMFAAALGNKELISNFLDRGADIHMVSSDGKTAYDRATAGNFVEVANLINSVGGEKIPTKDRAEISKMAKERAARERQARQQAETEAADADAAADAKKAGNGGFFGMFGM